MNAILLAVLVVAGLGLLFGLILAIASIVFAVPRNEKAEALREVLPGANCGACGYSGCDGYAAAMAEGQAAVGLCTPGGADVASACGALLGVEASLESKTCVIRCGGCDTVAKKKAQYRGVASCKAASQFFGGDKLCAYGCLGYGDCAAVCEYGAIVIEDGLCRIDPHACKACGACTKACPKHLLSIVSGHTRAVVRCHSNDKGPAVLKACGKGCIGCKKCVKACEQDAIAVQDFLAVIDPEKCIGCGQCAEVCPNGCIDVFGKESAL